MIRPNPANQAASESNFNIVCPNHRQLKRTCPCQPAHNIIYLHFSFSILALLIHSLYTFASFAPFVLGALYISHCAPAPSTIASQLLPSSQLTYTTQPLRMAPELDAAEGTFLILLQISMS